MAAIHSAALTLRPRKNMEVRMCPTKVRGTVPLVESGSSRAHGTVEILVLELDLC
jgi:hypothetical protein